MATASQHKAKAESNLKFLRTIGDDFPDWLATAAFYVALQLIEQLLAERGIHSKNHHDRKSSVIKDYPSISKHYQELYNFVISSTL
jgi:hypothetical protein